MHVKTCRKVKKEQHSRNLKNDVLTAVVEASEVEIPEVMIEDETDNLVREFEQRIQSQGFSLDQFKQITGQNDEMIRGEMRNDAESRVKVRLVLEAVAVEEKLAIEDADVDAEVERIANMYSMPAEQVKQLISRDAIAYDLRIRKALELIEESAGK